jgi:riboflavin kinase/FMN adenylyltransferase
VKIHNTTDHFEARNPVVTIGIFDGVHKGHREIIQQINMLAKKTQGESVLITFWPHPRIVLNHNSNDLKFLTTIEEKISLLKNLEIDHLIILPFTKDLSQLTASDFITKILVREINAKYLVLGFNNHIGRNREGNFETIKACAEQNGIIIKKASQKLINKQAVSSTIIRNALWQGEIRKAIQLLGYDFFVKGIIVEGKRIGRKLGFPTANITPDDPHKLLPKNGVYAVFLKITGNTFGGMLNIGIRPTVNTNKFSKTIEVNIFEFSHDIYGQEITLFFIDRIRDEIKFENADLLTLQLKKDKIAALRIIKKFK